MSGFPLDARNTTQNKRKEPSYPSSCPQVGTHPLPGGPASISVLLRHLDWLTEKSEEFTKAIFSDSHNPPSSCKLSRAPLFWLPHSILPLSTGCCFRILLLSPWALQHHHTCPRDSPVEGPTILNAGARQPGLNAALLYSGCVLLGQSQKPQVPQFFHP